MKNRPMQWDPQAWLTDPKLTRCSEATRGIWADWLSAMHRDGETGVVTGTYDQLARLGRTNPEAAQAAVADLRRSGAADVSQRRTRGGHAVVTLTNRRMAREYEKRNGNRVRKMRSRSLWPWQENGMGHGSVTDEVTHSSSDMSCDTAVTTPALSPLPSTPPQTPPLTPLTPLSPPVSLRAREFDQFWAKYPKRVGKRDALKAWQQTAGDRPSLTDLLARLEKLVASGQWKKNGGEYVPYPATWLRRGGWDDEPESYSPSSPATAPTRIPARRADSTEAAGATVTKPRGWD